MTGHRVPSTSPKGIRFCESCRQMRHRRRDLPALRQPVIYADSRTGAPEELLKLLDALGRKRHATAPFYVWHQVPDGLPENTQRPIASRACAAVHLTGYRVSINPDVADEQVLVAALAGPAPGPEQTRPSTPARHSCQARRTR